MSTHFYEAFESAIYYFELLADSITWIIENTPINYWENN